MKRELPTHCSCGTELVIATGIGLICTNKDCPISDGPFDGSEPVKFDYSSIVKNETEAHNKELLVKLEYAEKKFALAQKCINKLDDFFEYANDSAEDRNIVHKLLEQYTKNLVSLNKEGK